MLLNFVISHSSPRDALWYYYSLYILNTCSFETPCIAYIFFLFFAGRINISQGRRKGGEISQDEVQLGEGDSRLSYECILRAKPFLACDIDIKSWVLVSTANNEDKVSGGKKKGKISLIALLTKRKYRELLSQRQWFSPLFKIVIQGLGSKYYHQVILIIVIECP